MVRQMSSCRGSLGCSGEIPEDSLPEQLTSSMKLSQELKLPEMSRSEESLGSSADFWDEMDLEVLPGVTKRLIGSQATQDAFERGECVETTCLMCTIRMASVLDCEGVICPLCLSMSPMDSPNPEKAEGTVGLGIQIE